MSAAPAGAAPQSVSATPSNTFDPADVTVNLGETVTWTNSGGTHNVVFDDGSFTMPANASSSAWTVSRQFNATGTFRYYCDVHGAPGGVGMSGTVTVTGAGSPPPGGNPPPGYPPPGGSPGTGTPGTGTPGSGGGPGGSRLATSIKLRVSDSTPARGSRIRFFGTVRPAQDGRRIQLQRRVGGGRYRTVARIKLRDAGSSRSKFSKRLRVMADARFRARLPADDAYAAGTSRTRRVNVG